MIHANKERVWQLLKAADTHEFQSRWAVQEKSLITTKWLR